MARFFVAIPIALLPAQAVAKDSLPKTVKALAPELTHPTLTRITDPGRRLLALRSYVRMGGRIKARWSWDEAQIAAFQGSKKQIQLLKEVDAIKEHFAKANPGFGLYANTKVRSLNVQIARWNGNKSVKGASAPLLKAWHAKFCGGTNACADIDPKAAIAFLRSYSVRPRPRLAAPGLTLHGQANAIDFQVTKNGTIMMGASGRAIEEWDQGGWTQKLKDSIEAVGPSFSGPLQRPYEPWHYTFNMKATEGSASK